MLQVGEEVLLRDLFPSVGKGEATYMTTYTIHHTASEQQQYVDTIS